MATPSSLISVRVPTDIAQRLEKLSQWPGVSRGVHLRFN